MKPTRLLGISASVLLLAGTAEAQTTYFTNGVVRHQFWSDTNPNGVSNPTRLQVEQGAAGNPTFDDFSSSSMGTSGPLAARTTPPTLADFNLTVFDTPEEEGDNYADRVSTLFIPPTSGNYVFFVCSDDDSDLFVSTDATPQNKRMVAQEAGWSNTDQWVGVGGGSTLPQKRSDQFSPDGGVTVPFKNGIPMVAGQKYWIEAVHHEGGGGDQVGATFKLVGDPDPADGDASKLTGSVIGYGLSFTSPLTLARQVTNTTAYVGREASFTFVVNNPASDPLVNDAVTYQWQRNGSALAGATSTSYSFLTTAGDNGAQFQCIANLDPIYNISLSATSAVGTLTVNTASVSYTNGVKVERFLGASRDQVEANSTGPADSVRVSTDDGSASPLDYTGFENLPNDGVNNFTERASGWYIPPTTGNYVFFIAGDDDSDLFLSTDNTALHKQLIAQEQVWANPREWISDQGGGITNGSGDPAVFMKRSDQWTNDTGTAPFASGIALTAGTPYYIEAVHHQGGGGENVGVLAKLVSAPDPTNGAPPIPASQLSLTTSPTTTLTFSSPPQNVTVFEGGSAILSGVATSDSEFAVLYQWQRSGTNIPGATTSGYSFTTIAADTGSSFDLIAATAEGGLSITSAPVTVTVQTGVFENGLALMQYWINQGAASPEGTPPLGPPTFIMAVPSFEAGVNNENGDNYVNEVSGYFVPAVTGTYDFIVTGDDNCDLFLSTDSNPNNKRLICQVNNWSNALTWSTDSSGTAGGVQQKHSATWTNANSGGVAPFANGFNLTAGTKYYIEMWHHEGGGGDSCAATFTMRTGGVVAADPPDGTDSALTGSLLGFLAPAAHYVDFTQQPTNATALSGTTATFRAGGISDGTISIGTTLQFQTGTAAGDTNFLSFPNVLFQWYKNGTLIPGATTSTYMTPPLLPADNNAQYVAAIRALGIANWSNGTPAVLTVITDTNKPTVYSAVFDEQGLPVISVSFSKTMDLSTITNIANYSVSGGGAIITGILIDINDARHVQLQLGAEPTGPITLTLTGIKDFSGNSLVSSTSSVATQTLVNADVGDFTAGVGQAGFIAFPGAMYVDGAGAFTVTSEGSDIWDVSDGFNFSYEIKTNDFDVVVRQVSFTKVSNWSKGGLMVREDLTAGSRDWNIVNDPTSADGVNAIDGSGLGANIVESNARTTNSAASFNWSTAPTTAPAYPHAWVRLKRTGQFLQSFWSTNADGSGWTMMASSDMSTNSTGPLPANMYLGICCTAHANDDPSATVLRYVYTGSFADYNSSYIAPTNAVQARLSASVSAGNIVISWTPAGGTLQSSPTVGPGATWSPAGTANPATIPISGNAKFFRVGP